MSKQIISSTKITKSYQTSNTCRNYNENQRNQKNDKNEEFSQSRMTKEIQNKFNLDSSIGTLQQRSTLNQNFCTCGKFKTDTHSTYNNTIQTNLTGEDYCTCDDAKDYSLGGNCYKRITNKTVNKTLSLNEQNIFIQDGSNTDYCNCEEREDRKILSTITSDYNENLPNILTDEEINLNYCTCCHNLKSTLESSGNKGKFSNLLQYSSNYITTSNNELPIQTTDFEEREINRKNLVKKVINTQINIDIVRKEVREKIKQDLKEQKERNHEQITWNGENYIQVIERLQYLTVQPPTLKVQFLNDMMIKRTIIRAPIHILSPIPDNYIQKQEIFQVLSEQKEEKEEEKIELCPENVDILNISHAYSIQVPLFNNLEIENEEMFIKGVPKIEEQPELTVEQYSIYCQGKEKEPFIIENYAWDINPSERMWSDVMRPVRVNKLEIKVPKKDWNNLEKELISNLDVRMPIKKKEKKKKEKKVVVEEVEEEPEEEVEEEPEEESEEEPEEEPEEEEIIEEVEQGDDEEVKKRKLEREKRRKEKELRNKRKDQKRFRKNKFTLTFKENKKRFKQIDIGDNNFITLIAEKRVLDSSKNEKKLEPSEKIYFLLGGTGFDENKYKWVPVPFNTSTMAIEKTKKEAPLENISVDKLDIPAAKKRRQDWNLINNLSSESIVNILTKEKKLLQERAETITSIGKGGINDKWNEKIRRQKGFKQTFYPIKKSFILKICKEIDILYEQEADDVIINDDYNNVKGPEMRPVTATIIKIKEEDDTSSISSYDVFQNLVIRRDNFQYDLGGNDFFGASRHLLKGKGEYDISYGNGSSGFMKTKKNFEFRSGLGRGKNGFGYEYEFGMNKSGGKFGLGLESSKNLKTSNYDYNLFGPSFNKNIISQTKIITSENSSGKYNDNESNLMNEGISISKKSYGEMNKKITGEINKYSNFPSFGEQGNQNMFKIRVLSNAENEQKNKYDKTVKYLAAQTKNLIGNMKGNMSMEMSGNMNSSSNMNSNIIMRSKMAMVQNDNNMRDTRNIMREKKKKIELIREDSDQPNYLKV